MQIGTAMGLLLVKQILNQLSIKGEDASKLVEAQAILQQAMDANQKLEKENEALIARAVRAEERYDGQLSAA